MQDEKKPTPMNGQPTASKSDPRVTTVYGDSRPLVRDGMLRDILALQMSFSILLLVLAIWSQLQEISASLKALQEGQQLCAGGPLD